jgi:isoquinoline 1-oxidoreductase beta subunit
MHECFGSIAAHVAEVSLGTNQQIRVHRVVCAIDCGFPVNPNLIAQQTESCVVFGLSALLYGNIDIESGQVKQGNFHEFQVARMFECPQIETHVVPSSEPPEGIGEPGLPPLAPAVSNALFVLSGQRLRSLPLKLAA